MQGASLWHRLLGCLPSSVAVSDASIRAARLFVAVSLAVACGLLAMYIIGPEDQVRDPKAGLQKRGRCEHQSRSPVRGCQPGCRLWPAGHVRHRPRGPGASIAAE